jgi:hypothetical protein
MSLENLKGESFADLNRYVDRLNQALKEGKGISFHNNGGIIVRNPPGISLGNPPWDLIGNFGYGECNVRDSCDAESPYGIVFSGINGPYKERLFFVEENLPKFGYQGSISIPEEVVSGLRTIPRLASPVPKWNTDYGPIIGRLSVDPNHIHNDQAELFSFNDEVRIRFG